MKSFTLTIVVLCFISILSCQQENQNNSISEKSGVTENIVLLDSATYLYQAGDFYIAGQPTDSSLKALKMEGLGLIINLRTEKEMESIKENGFDEEALADSLGIPYIKIPMGSGSGYTPETIKAIDDAIKQYPGKPMIHCRSAGRATYAWMAWLINFKDVPVDEAITLGKQIRFHLSLEDLLGYELSFDKKPN